MGAVVSVIDGGFRGFSDSDDDMPNNKFSRATTPKPIVLRKEEIDLYNENKAEQNAFTNFTNYRRSNMNNN